ncbi:MAG: thioredoxin domain-containing protein [Saprospiraceae bacterium]|nr:thioredoxin domain-containing protein [Saprospiraceae bacterium]
MKYHRPSLLVIISLYVAGLLTFYGCKAQDTSSTDYAYTNELINESSPYLLQHAHNPVNWHPWNEKSLQKAKEEDKMLLISVGYAACHWCHVMEHESFEDTSVARIMNQHFIPIKVDREERPDVDDIYITACQMSTGKNCGWPLNAFALPDGRPVWAGTYFPKKNWIEILEYFVKLYQEDRDKLEEYATTITDGLQGIDDVPVGDKNKAFKAEDLVKINKEFVKSIDFKRGGQSGAPKFPKPSNYEYLLEQFFRTGEAQYWEAVEVTLDNMAKGGIYDHVGGGFARYSTDANWKVPHFEKMLYDNSQLVSIYAKAYQVKQKPRYKEIIEETLGFIERELTDASGGFYSSLDADSEGVEGKFYVWTKSEIDSIIGDEQISEWFRDFYQIKERGNWEHQNIIYHEKSLAEFAASVGQEEASLKQTFGQIKAKLLEARAGRVRPGLDDKVLTGWNAMMLEGYVDAYKALGEAKYLDMALKNGQFLLENMLQADARLNRNFKDGKSSINGFLDDYALSIQAFMALYEVTFDEKWLDRSKGLADYAMEHFLDTSSYLFNYTSDLDPPLIARKKELGDGAIPSSNSSMARALFSLGTYLYEEAYQDLARQMMTNLVNTVEESQQPSFYSNWLQLYQSLATPPYEVAVVGPNAGALSKELMTSYLPNSLFLGGTAEGSLELLKDKLVEGETYIYVCQNKVCRFPVQTAAEALEQLQN